MPGIGALGLATFIALAWALGTDRRAANWRVLGWGVGLQLLLGLVVFRTRAGYTALLPVNDAVNALLATAGDGPAFLVGALADPAATVLLGR